MKLLQRIFGTSSNGRKPTVHSDSFVPKWQRLPDSVAKEYETSTVFEIATRHTTSDASVSKKLRSLGVKLRSPSAKPPGRPDTRCKLTQEQIAWALEQDDKDVPHADIGRELGVSRERIRQICSIAGKPTRRSRQTKTIEIKEASAARQLEREQRLLAISEAWKGGATLYELNDAFFHYSHPYSVSQKISGFRQHHPDMFPLRMKPHGGVPQPEEEIRKLSELWLAGKSKQEIADATGYKSAGSLAISITRLRNRFPRMFPPRKRHSVMAMDERVNKLSELWKANKPAVEIMEAMGYKNLKSVYQAVAKVRKQYPDRFPLRAPSPPSKK